MPPRPAPLDRRLAAWLLDAAIGGLVFTPVVVGLQFAFGGPPDIDEGRMTYAEFLDEITPFLLALGVVEVVGFVLAVAFDGSRRGATPGKRIAGLRVGDAATLEPIGFPRALLRRVVYVLGYFPILAGWWWVLVDPRRQAWHDKAARSIVVVAEGRHET